jgi:hypothetical protein
MKPIDPREHPSHDLDALSEALDGRLQGEGLEAVLGLVRSCAECRAAYEALAWTKAQAGRTPAVTAPPELEEEIRRGLDRGAVGPPRARTRRAAVFAALAALVVLALAAALVRLRPASPPPTLPQAVAEDFRNRGARTIALGIETTDPARLEAWLDSASLGFPTRVFDLRMMGYELRGGAVDSIAGRASALVVYREVATGREVICRMLLGRLRDLPPPDEALEHDGIRFQVYEAGRITLVFWPEGEVLCMLAGDGDREALVQLAFAKAMRAQTLSRHETHLSERLAGDVRHARATGGITHRNEEVGPSGARSASHSAGARRS